MSDSWSAPYGYRVSYKVKLPSGCMISEMSKDGEMATEGNMTVVVFDGAQGSGSWYVQYVLGRTSVRVRLPSEGESVKGKVNLVVSVNSALPISKVEYRIDSDTWTSMTVKQSDISAEWDSTSVANGKHKIEFRATDSKGGSSTATVTVVVDNPALLGGPVLYIIIVAVLVAAIVAAMFLRKRAHREPIQTKPFA